MTGFNPGQWSIRWQIAVLLILTQVLAHGVTIMMIDQSLAREGGGRVDLAISISEPMLTALRMSNPTDVGDLSGTFAELMANDDRFSLEGGPLVSSAALDDVLATALIRTAPPDWQSRMRVFRIDDGPPSPMLPMRPFAVAAELPTGEWLVFEARGDTLIQRVPRTIVLQGCLSCH